MVIKEKHCSICGNELKTQYIKNEGNIPYCEHCDQLYFPTSDIAVIGVVYNDQGKILLLRQSYVSHEYHSLVAGYYLPGEDLEGTFIRETKEETNIDISNPTYLGSFYYEKKNLVMTGYYSKAISNDLVLNTDEVDEASWYNLEEAISLVRPQSIAFKVLNRFKMLSLIK